MCCGSEACDFAARDNPFLGKKKRETKDVTAVKRSPLVRREDCAFNPNDPEAGTTITYGPQVIVSTTSTCPAGGDTCDETISISGSYTVTNTFGVEGE